jgi:hypothetical protein
VIIRSGKHNKYCGTGIDFGSQSLVTENSFSFGLRKTKTLFLAEHQTKFPKRAEPKKNNNPILRKTKPKRKQRKEEKNNNTANIATVKTACEKLTTEGNRNTSER